LARRFIAELNWCGDFIAELNWCGDFIADDSSGRP